MPERFVSPNEMFEEAKNHMLDGREPESIEDWMKIVNFFSYNISEGLELPATKLMAKILAFRRENNRKDSNLSG